MPHKTKTRQITSFQSFEVLMKKVESEKPEKFSTRVSWRRWLGKNGSRDEALCAGWIDGKMKSIDSESYKLWFSPRRPGSPWSKLNRERAEALIKQALMTPSGFAAIDAAKQNGKWQAAYSSRRIGVVLERVKKNLKPDIGM